MTIETLLNKYKVGDCLYHGIIARNCRISMAQEKEIIADLLQQNVISEISTLVCPVCHHDIEQLDDDDYECYHCDSSFHAKNNLPARTYYRFLKSTKADFK